MHALYAMIDGTELALRVDVDLRLEPPSANTAPTVSAGPNQTVTLNAGGTVQTSLAGSASDDGLPNPPGALTVSWSRVSGPGTVVFANAALAGTTATFNQAGAYVLRLTATDSLLSVSADVTITVNPVVSGNQAPVISGLPAALGLTLPVNSTTFTPTVTDDGLPNPPAALTYAWSKVSGGTVTFSTASNKDTTATFAATGTYVLRLTASDSLLSTTRDISVTVNAAGATNQPPVVSAGPNQAITLPALATLAGTATDDGLPNPPARLTTTWSMVSGPAAGVAFTDPASPTTSVTFSAPGTYVLRLTAGDGALSATSDTQVTVTDGAPLLLNIPDRTISLGTRYQQLLVARDGNVNDSLTYTLVTSPAGAALNPSPLVDWVPTAAQLGAHTFTAKVVDALGHTATTSFTVTVVHTNQPPQLATQTNVILPVGTSFNRVLQGRDPDAGDALTYALVSGPPGMALSGATLDWSTLGRPPGDYLVTVRVTDGGGLFDSKQFTVTLTPSAPGPTAKDDSYTVRLGETLTVAAPGVLGNDISPGGRPLTALEITDPTKGTLSAFNANGGFSYTAPATLPPRALNPVVSFRGINGGSTVFQYAADFDRDGKADYVSSDFGNFRAWRGSDGAQLGTVRSEYRHQR
ncbi:MAG: PKD domain-containing protein [Betaproteobacteria bacterium]|nr:PKD domain-containing protein [Betaproteobacteria bacterium]